MAPKIERIIENLVLGEGPHWDAETQSLFLVDILGKAIYRYVPSTKKYTKATVDRSPSLLIPLRNEKNKFVITLERELSVINWDGESDKISIAKKLAEVENPPDSLGVKFNDGKCDPSGRLWAGTMASMKDNGEFEVGTCSFYSFQNNKLTTFFSGVTISNGLAFNVGLKKSYYIDSPKNTVDEFDFDIEKGTIANRKPIFTFSKHNIPGGPDGMTIDADGNLWVAVFNGSRVIKIDPRRPETLLDTIELPTKQVTSVAFGGPNLDELYVTTAALPIGGEKPNVPDAGGVFRITGLNAKGLPGVSVLL